MTFVVSARVSNAKPVEAKLRLGPIMLHEEIEDANDRAGNVVMSAARGFAPKATGETAARLGYEQQHVIGSHTWDVVATSGTPQGEFLEHGTGDLGPYHRPFPVHTDDGGIYFHHGMKPEPFLEPAVQLTRTTVIGIYEVAANNLARRIG